MLSRTVWRSGGAALPAAIAAAAICGAAAADAAVPRQVGSLTYTTTVPAAPAGLVANFEFQNPEDPSLKPHAAATMVVHRPAGSVIDTTVPDQCRASNAELMIQGPAACPPGSRIGTAVAVSDTGSSGPLPRFTRTNITNLNNQDEIIGVGENEDLPLIRPVDRTKIEGDRTTTNFPTLPGQPPPDHFTAFKSLRLQYPPYVREGRTYNRTPPTCPASGYWTITIEFTYRDGVTETVESRSPCVQPTSLRIGHRDVIVDRRGTLLELGCGGASGARCTGTVRLEPTAYATRLERATSAKVAEFDLAAGTKKPVRVQVPRQSRARLARRRKAVVRAVAILSDGRVVRRLISLYVR
ncbi:MAG TPA: hypothetical protein VF712_13830 [Thermoleophilaceae bacterium]